LILSRRRPVPTQKRQRSRDYHGKGEATRPALMDLSGLYDEPPRLLV
jgi:hypothetical protein